MPRKFTQIAFTPTIKALQAAYGSREMYDRMEEAGPENDTLISRVTEFVEAQDSFYMGSTNADGWPYIQFRGGPVGFLKVLDERTLGFADFKGNGQYLSIGNLADNDRVFLFLMDYVNRRRLKIWGRATVEYERPDLLAQLQVPGYGGEAQRAIVIRVEAWDWNCPQHIPQKFSAAEVAEIIAPLQAQIDALQAQVEEYRPAGS